MWIHLSGFKDRPSPSAEASLVMFNLENARNGTLMSPVCPLTLRPCFVLVVVPVRKLEMKLLMWFVNESKPKVWKFGAHNSCLLRSVSDIGHCLRGRLSFVTARCLCARREFCGLLSAVSWADRLVYCAAGRLTGPQIQRENEAWPPNNIALTVDDT